MSDQNIKKYEETGWLQMSAMLDREMPQKKKRRRFVYMFWIPVLITGLSLIFFFLGRYTTKNTNKLANTALALQAVSDEYRQDSSVDQIYQHNKERALALSVREDKPIHIVKNKLQENRDKVITEVTKELMLHNFDDIRPVSKWHKKGEIPVKSFSNGEISERGHFMSSVNTIKIPVRDRDTLDGLSIRNANQESSLSVIDYLPACGEMIIQKNKSELCPAIKIEKNKHEDRRYQSGLRFAIGKLIDINCLKLQAGVCVEKRLNNRWAVEINPQLDISRSHFITVPDVNDNAFQQVLSNSRLTSADIFEGKISNTSSTNGDLALISSLSKVNNLYRIAVPVNVKYRISRGLHLSAGISPHCLIGHDLRKSKIYQEDLVNQYKYYQQSNLNVSIQGGLQYNYKNFGVDLNYTRLVILPNNKKISNSTSGPVSVLTWTQDPLQELTLGMRWRM